MLCFSCVCVSQHVLVVINHTILRSGLIQRFQYYFLSLGAPPSQVCFCGLLAIFKVARASINSLMRKACIYLRGVNPNAKLTECQIMM